MIMVQLFRILILIVIFSKNLYSFELITDSHLKVTLKTHALPNGSKFSICDSEGTWTDNYGNYRINTC